MNLLALWIWISVVATSAGWILSAMGQLNRAGYVVAAGIAAAVLFVWRESLGVAKKSCRARGQQDRQDKASPALVSRLHNRFRRPLPFCFAILVGLVFVGGALYPPSNHTALSYRTSRVLHWLSTGGWNWIHTQNFRMNDRACGIEWLSAPLLLFTGSDRLIFLLNFIPYLLLPGLIFSLCRSSGVCARVAWQWMWIFPAGYSFLLQAGSAGNDTFPTVYALASIYFALRAWKFRELSALWLSGLSAMLLTGAKASNLPLLLPWGLVLLPVFPLAKKNALATAVVAIVALLVSFLPTALLNVHYCHDWSGLKMENAGMNMKNPLVGIWGNIFIFLLDNFVPPFFPLAGWWNAHGLALLPQWLVRPLNANFESGYHVLGELPTEDWVGMGLGVSLLVAVSILASFHYYRRAGGGIVTCRPAGAPLPQIIKWGLFIAPWIALLAYCMKSGMVTGARLISPYYPFLLPSLLAIPGQSALVRRRWWKILVWMVMLVAFPVLLLTPGRPLWPAQTVLTKIRATHPSNRPVARALAVYHVYSIRSDPLAQVRALLPQDLAVVGFMGAEDDIDISLWRPFGRRIVKHILHTDSAEAIRRRGIEYIVVGELNLKLRGDTFEAWLQRTGAELIASTVATVKVVEGPQPWHVVRLKS